MRRWRAPRCWRLDLERDLLDVRGVDIDAYFRRIGYAGPRAPTRATLDGLCAAHVSAIPFENLDVLLGIGVDLSDDAVDRKLIAARRGGYCFEQNSLLLRVLVTLGFDAKPISARVRVQRPRDFTPPRTHMLVRVELDGESLLADVGVGGLSPTSSLSLTADVEQPTPHETRRLVREGGLWFHQACFGGEWHDVWESTLEGMPPIDREVGNWFTSTHPNSHFRNRLLVARARPSGARTTLLNRELTLREGDGSLQKEVVASPAELLEVLARHFELRFPEGTHFACSGLDWPS